MPPRSMPLAMLALASLAPGLLGQDIAQRRLAYATVASNLAPTFADGSPPESATLEPAILESKERWRVITLESVETRDQRLKAVAKEAAAAHAQILDIAKGDQESGDVLAAVLASLFSAHPVPLLLGAASREGSKATRYSAAVQRRRAATFLLAELARELSGEARKEPVVDVDFDENWFGEKLPDRINLTNISGVDLTNCTVQVDLRGKSGPWVRNVHYLSAWPKDRKIWADYVTSDPALLASISGTTATEVQEVNVSVWSDELRAEGLVVGRLGWGL